MCRHNWHSAGSLGWPFPMLKHKYIFFFQIKYTEAILSNGTRELLWFEIIKILIAVFKNKFIASFVIIFGTTSIPMRSRLFDVPFYLEDLAVPRRNRREIHSYPCRRRPQCHGPCLLSHPSPPSLPHTYKKLSYRRGTARCV